MGRSAVMRTEQLVGPASDLPPGKIKGVGRYAVGNADGEYFAVTRRCRHLYADLARGKIDKDGCLVCPWHASKYDVKTGRMLRGPQGWFAKVPGLDAAYIALTKVLPLGRGKVVEREGNIYVS
jgi:3-phenylpropionate/trans-cinnamate dioxygenase ferredoxin component